MSAFLDERRRPYAVIGGVRLGGYGMTRHTFDLDLVVDAGVQTELVAFMESVGYETLYRSTGYSNHLHAEQDRGRVDFVYVRDTTSRKLFDAVRHVDGPAGARIPVPSPEHLIAMKLVAMKNDPTRTFQDLADIRTLPRSTAWSNRTAPTTSFSSSFPARRSRSGLRGVRSHWKKLSTSPPRWPKPSTT